MEPEFYTPLGAGDTPKSRSARVSRRSFIKGIIATGATVASGSMLGTLAGCSAETSSTTGIAGTVERLITLNINGKSRRVDVLPQETLAMTLRYKLGLTGTKLGCDRGECGACTVLINDRPRHSCLTLAVTCQGARIETVDGLSRDNRLSALQRGFDEKLGAQCGFCTPGMIMASEALLRANPKPDEAAIRNALAANICRCTGYVKIIEAVQFAAEIANEIADEALAS